MITKHHPATTVLLLAMATAFPRLSAAWYGDGHVLATRIALAAAGTNLPPCIVHNTDILLHCVQDPDMFRKAPAPQLPAQEPPEHFIDLELMRGAALPATRPEYVRLCAATADPRKGPNSRVDPFDAGFLPYSILEWAQRLTVAFREYRDNPADRAAAVKCAVYAGIMLHYAQDLTQPLHTTIHYDGRAAGSRSPRTGIHAKMDALLAKTSIPPDFPYTLSVPTPRNMQEFVFSELAASHAMVVRVFEIEKMIPEIAEKAGSDPDFRKFALDRAAATARFSAALLVGAWRDSDTFVLPPWRSSTADR